MSDTYFYRVVSIWAPKLILLEKAYSDFFDLLNVNFKDEYLAAHRVQHAELAGFEYGFDVRDLHEQTIDYLKTTTALFMETLPIDTPLVVYSHWMHRFDLIAVTLRVEKEIVENDHPLLRLGNVVKTIIIVEKDDWPPTKEETMSVNAWTAAEIDEKNNSVNARNTEFHSNTFHDYEYQKLEEASKLFADSESNFDAIIKETFEETLRKETKLEPWTAEEEKTIPDRCMCRFRRADFQSTACGHEFMCDECYDKYKKTSLYGQCPKCNIAIIEVEKIHRKSAMSPQWEKPIDGLDVSMLLEDINDDDDSVDAMDIDFYSSSDDEKGTLVNDVEDLDFYMYDKE